MVFRVYIEKKKNFARDAETLLAELRDTLGIKSLENIRVLNRYDVENIDEKIFKKAVTEVFSEPPTDDVFYKLPECPQIFGVEYLPGQFDQRADSAEQCVQFISQGERPVIRTAKIYLLHGNLSKSDLDIIKRYLINPVECREAELGLKKTLVFVYGVPKKIELVQNFTAMDGEGLKALAREMGLAMDEGDIRLCQKYFASVGRQPTVTEIKVLDTYWSDHCRHTTFSTVIDNAVFESPFIQKTYEEYLAARKSVGREKPVTLMDLATVAMRRMKREGKLGDLDRSDEINACTVKIKVDIGGKREDWLLLFKNETHNHPTEIEPFGGAATCIGGAIRDPLSGRAYVYAAMRLTGAGNPLAPIGQTLKGKLPQRKIVKNAASGYSSYGNQIGLATGLVDEIYHDGFAAKRMEIGAVIGAVPGENVVREKPVFGDAVILIGGRTGRDGCGGATGSSKAHTAESLTSCGAEVQKGNAPEERKIQRFFRNKAVSTLIKRCNDFGAGGVSVAVGELADGVEIWLDKVPKKYEGLNGTELAISESQERMAVVVAKEAAEKFIDFAKKENLEATQIAAVTKEPRLVMYWNGQKIVDIEREFLNSNGAEKHTDVFVEKPRPFGKKIPDGFADGMRGLAGNLNACSKRGLREMFDSTIGAGTVLLPLGGRCQSTPTQAMVQKIPLENGDTSTCSAMSWGYNPFISEKSPYHGAYLAVAESAAKLVATGAGSEKIYLTFQEYFEKLGSDPKKWGKPFAALLGAFKAQTDLSIASVGGKDSMSGTFENLNVPPTLVSFAVSTADCNNIISPEFKKANNKVVLLSPRVGTDGLPDTNSLKENFGLVNKLIKSKTVVSAYTPGLGGVAESIFKMCLGNRLGFRFENNIDLGTLFGYNYGAFVLELASDIEVGEPLGRVTEKYSLKLGETEIGLAELEEISNSKLESVYPTKTKAVQPEPEKISFINANKQKCRFNVVKPRVLIPVFPGTNCEYDTAKAFSAAGAETDVFVVNNLSVAGIKESLESFAEKLKNSQILFIPGGFSGGDEPDGSAKFITAFMRNAVVAGGLEEFLGCDGLMCGVCNGFQALVKLGLIPFGKITPPRPSNPTLTFNDISRHQSKIVRVRVSSNLSPWLNGCEVGQVYSVPVSHGEGKFVADTRALETMRKNGQIATQYVDFDGNPSNRVEFNPNGSVWAIEGVTSADGRIFGKMGHSERSGKSLYKNVAGDYDMKIMQSAVEYFK